MRLMMFVSIALFSNCPLWPPSRFPFLRFPVSCFLFYLFFSMYLPACWHAPSLPVAFSCSAVDLLAFGTFLFFSYILFIFWCLVSYVTLFLLSPPPRPLHTLDNLFRKCGAGWGRAWSVKNRHGTLRHSRRVGKPDLRPFVADLFLLFIFLPRCV